MWLLTDPFPHKFVNKLGVSTLFLADSLNLTGFVSTAHVYSVVSPCKIANESYVATILTHVDGAMGFTPVYALHADQFEDVIGAPLMEAYNVQNHGAIPPADPPVNMTWTDGLNAITRARYPESQRRRAVFEKWFNHAILPTNDETRSEPPSTHLPHPPNTAKTDNAPARLTDGWHDEVYTKYAGHRQIVVPVGQVEYWSTYTRRIGVPACEGCAPGGEGV
ncbi:hypothetical protein B0H63DRAFT_455975 [Podospora didyma]|uniref:Uncharacterized protein n=1 Tax=Podospora didyma TaxID=330526 RepID=A0AAE0N2L0_9PEZI|nr:hypothetical protein B0H63DRAFT_455975 [Podospora didyma]